MKKHKWTKEQVESASTPNYSKLYVIKPALLKLLGDIKDKKVLELGCGNGFWLRILASKGAKCTGIDKSKNQLSVAIAKNKESKTKVDYLHGDISNLREIKKNRFDIVLIEKVFLEVSSLNKIRKILRNAYKSTKEGGFVIVSEFHPAGLHFELSNIKPSKEYSYFNSGSIFQVISTRIDGKKTYYNDYHWTIEDICNSITNEGYKIVKVLEPRPSKLVIKKYPYLSYRKNKPLALVVKAVKG